jgi:CheY-like chemotaxis protein
MRRVYRRVANDRREEEVADRQCRVFIVEHDPDGLEMLKSVIGQMQGCETRGSLAIDPDNLGRIKAFGPELIILDFVPGYTQNWRLLDELRADEATSPIPVLALSTSEPVVEQSVASYNVRRVLIKPFDLDVLDQAVRDLRSAPKPLIQPASARVGAEELRQAADILAAEAREVVIRWLGKVSEIEPFRSERRLRPQQRIDVMPVVLWGTVVALRTGAPERLFEEKSTFREASTHHAELRRGQGVPLGALAREYELLRDTIWQTLRDKAPPEWTAGDVFRVGEVVHHALDEAIAVAVESYRQAEEREAGRGG